ncbi:3-hydroxyacyl-CoA dehydrogenase family protein [Amycolatopsis pittospori]|uniref:3-hydroxyacyl-CoA dehydrogenase family protein n=1 Tax=Amycolatopsis pittospori TaxID=2749434 RepID=UPI0015F1221D|nr:3-hydroxyacyl-CoA dehydrogenase family protein [Amycolatopsis pittospori]
MSTEKSLRRLSRIAVVGAGVMGSGIAATALGHGVDVVLVDVDSATLEQARRRIGEQLRHASLLGALPEVPAGELTATTVIGDVAGAAVVIEAVTELPEAKAKALAEISGAVSPGTPLISNTSGIPIDELAEWTARPEDLAGTHFMNPTYLIKMVEVVRAPRTSEAAMATIIEMLTALERTPVVVADAPGFVTSRLLHPMINNATRVVGAGTATAESVDALMCGCLGHPTGPLRTADLIGLDNLVDSLNALYERTGDESCLPSEPLLEKVRAGDLGRKTGRGFYDYGKAMT